MKPELIIAMVSGVFAILSALTAYKAQLNAAKSQSDSALAQQAVQQAHERKSPFVDAQIKFYIETIDTAVKISLTADSDAREILVRCFWELYWGRLALVEDDEVAGAMIEYGKTLKDNPNDSEGLAELSLDIAHACRNSLKHLWTTELGDIKNERPRASHLK